MVEFPEYMKLLKKTVEKFESFYQAGINADAKDEIYPSEMNVQDWDDQFVMFLQSVDLDDIPE